MIHAFLLLHTYATAPPPSPFETAVRSALTADLSDFAARNSLGIWFAYRNASEKFAVSIGVADGRSRAATNADIVPIGSYAKPWTAVAVMRLVESGVIHLDDLAAPLIDPYLAHNATSLARIYGTMVNTITVHDLLHMTSGLESYDDDVIHNLTLGRPDYDISPFDYLALAVAGNLTSITCACSIPIVDPRSGQCRSSTRCCNATHSAKCPHYNSMNYLLLGMLLASQSNASRWESVDQKAAALAGSSSAAASVFNETTFYKHGHCAAYAGTTPFFDFCWRGGTGGAKNRACAPGFAPGSVNMSETSCLNGWAFGNIGSSARNAAEFFWRLLATSQSSSTIRTSTTATTTTAAVVHQFTDAFDRADGELGNGWVEGWAATGNYSQLGISGDAVAVIAPTIRNGTYPPAGNTTCSAIGVPGEILAGIGCAWRETNATSVNVSVRWSGLWTFPNHIEAAPLLHVTPGTSSLGIGIWPAILYGEPVLFVGTIGNPGRLFNVTDAARFNHTEGEQRVITAQSNGTAVRFFLDGVQVKLNTAGYDPLPVPHELRGSTLHGLAVDTHCVSPYASAMTLPAITEFIVAGTLETSTETDDDDDDDDTGTQLLNATSVHAMTTFGPGNVEGRNTTYGLGIWRTDDLSLGYPDAADLNVTDPNVAPLLVYFGCAIFFSFSLFAQRLISADLQYMTAFGTFSPFHYSLYLPLGFPLNTHYSLRSHAGDDYGTVSRSAYHPALGFAFSIMINRQWGVYPGGLNGTNIHGIYCLVWRRLFTILRLDASIFNCSLVVV